MTSAAQHLIPPQITATCACSSSGCHNTNCVIASYWQDHGRRVRCLARARRCRDAHAAKAHLRRERLTAKSGGPASRLQKISALEGGPPKTLTTPCVLASVAWKACTGASTTHIWLNVSLVQPSASRAECGTATPDPEDSDISQLSQHHYTPASQARVPSPFAFNGNATSAILQFL